MATVSTTGVVNGVGPGTLDITFTDPSTSCYATYTITVDPQPSAIGGLSDVCVGSAITLTDITTGGTFSGGGAFAVVAPGGLVNGMTAGVTNATYTITSTSCFVTTPLTVNPLPAPISEGSGIVCQNATLPFTDSDPGGTWTSAGSGIATVGALSGIVTGTGPGITTIIYTLPTGCAGNIGVTVNASPVSVISAAGPTTFCAGNSVVLTGTAGAGDTYQWNLGGVPIPGATTTSFSASATGAYTFSVQNTLGCTTVSVPVNVVDGITGLVQHTAPLAFCYGNAVALTANTGTATGSITYQWSLNGVDIAGAVNQVYNAAVSGLYRCHIVVSGGGGTCSIYSDSAIVNVHPLPIPAISYNGMVLSTASGYTGYQWYLNTVSVPGANSYIFSPTANGVFKVLVTDGNGCSGFSSDFALTNVGVSQVINPDYILVTPNPATTTLHISAPVTTHIIITGLEGKIMIDQSGTDNINIGDLASGLYLISIYDLQGNKLKVDKFIKE